MKQRLVGAVVLGCLAIIFIPILLDGEGLSAPEFTRSIPEPPPIPPAPDIQPTRPQISADLVQGREMPALPDDEAQPAEDGSPAPAQPEQPEQETAPARDDSAESAAGERPEPEQPRLDAQGLPEAWQVQLGTFGQRANAEGLVSDLLAKGYKAYSRPAGNLTSVYVGPVLTRADAEQLRERLAAEFELQGLVQRFSIETPRQ